MKKLFLSLINKFLVYTITFYQTYLSFDHGLFALLAPGGACKYELSCSEYTKEMISEFGAFKGSWMGIKRIGSCR